MWYQLFLQAITFLFYSQFLKYFFWSNWGSVPHLCRCIKLLFWLMQVFTDKFKHFIWRNIFKKNSVFVRLILLNFILPSSSWRDLYLHIHFWETFLIVWDIWALMKKIKSWYDLDLLKLKKSEKTWVSFKYNSTS